MGSNNIILNKRIRKESIKYNTEKYDTLTPAQKEQLHGNLNKTTKQTDKKHRKREMVKPK